MITGNVPGLGYFHGEVGVHRAQRVPWAASAVTSYSASEPRACRQALRHLIPGNDGGRAQEQTRIYRALSGVNLSNLPPNASYNANTSSGLVVQTQQTSYATSPRLQGPATWGRPQRQYLNQRIRIRIRFSNRRSGNDAELEFSVVAGCWGCVANETQRLSLKSFTPQPGLEDAQSTTPSRAIAPDQPPLGLIEAIQLDQPNQLSPRLVGEIEASLFAPLQTTRTKPNQEAYLDLLAQIKGTQPNGANPYLPMM